MKGKKHGGKIEDMVITDMTADEMYHVRHHKAVIKKIIDDRIYFVSYNELSFMYEVRTYD
jgi:hypothetical protein